MKTITYLLAGWLTAGGLGLGSACAQSGVRAAGGLATGAGGTASYSVGQLTTVVARGPGGTLSPGVQQPLVVTALGATSPAAIQLESSVYPNPTPALLHLRVASPMGRNLSWRLTDLSGRQLLGQPLTETLTAISLIDFAAGAYLITIFSNAHPVKAFKVIKP